MREVMESNYRISVFTQRDRCVYLPCTIHIITVLFYTIMIHSVLLTLCVYVSGVGGSRVPVLPL